MPTDLLTQPSPDLDALTSSLRERLVAERPELAAVLSPGEASFAADSMVPLLLQRMLGDDHAGDDDVVSDAVADLDRVTAERDALLRRLERANETLRVLADEAEHAGNHLDELAAALGACEECWGDDETCVACGGRGVPGWERPDTAAFVHYVAPVITRLRAARARPAPLSSSGPSRRAHPATRRPNPPDMEEQP